jgi:hypothetical protein
MNPTSAISGIPLATSDKKTTEKIIPILATTGPLLIRPSLIDS